MNTFRGWHCQTWRCIVFVVFCAAVAGRAGAAVEPAQPPPAWQREIDAAQLLEGSLALTPAKGPAEEAARHARLQETYRQLASRYPDAPAAQKAAGSYLSRAGTPAAALPYWQRAATLDPRDADTASQLGGTWLALGKVRDACVAFGRAVDLQPNVGSYHSDLANVLYLFRHDLVAPPLPGLPDERTVMTQALAHFQRAAELSPTDPQLAQAYAETFYMMPSPDWAQALAAWETVRALSGNKTDFADSHLARVSLRMGKPSDAVAYLAKIHDPQFEDLKAKLLKQAEKQRQEAGR